MPMNSLTRSANIKKQNGIAMLEVLMAIVVVAFGFMALLKLQVSSLNNVVASNQRYVAASLASTMGERIRANAFAPAAGGASPIVGYQGVDTASNDMCGSSGIVATDVCEWSTEISNARNALPSGSGRIDIDGLNAVIRISWSEKRRNAKDSGGTVIDIETASYFLEVPINDNL